MPLARRANTDPVLYYQTQDKWVREYWVHVEYMKLLKDEVRNCYRREGVNHYENCRDLVQEYYKRTKAPSALRPAAPRTRPCPHPRSARSLRHGPGRELESTSVPLSHGSGALSPTLGAVRSVQAQVSRAVWRGWLGQ